MSARQNPVDAQKARRSAASDDLSSRVAASGLVQPGAHAAEFDVDTPMDKLVRTASSVGNWLNSHFGTKHTPKPVANSQPKTP